MEYNFEHSLRLIKEAEKNSSFPWHIIEVDNKGRNRGEGQIPWPWTLYFTALDCDLIDGVKVCSREHSRAEWLATPTISSEQFIRIQLAPENQGSRTGSSTAYSMFGTDRLISDFRLEIYKTNDEVNTALCEAWGCVSYSTEDDFKKITTDDCVHFSMFVGDEDFKNFYAAISSGTVDEITFGATNVEGFYSPWSPSVSTHGIKVLATGTEQTIQFPEKSDILPPRLGRIGEARLRVRRRFSSNDQR